MSPTRPRYSAHPQLPIIHPNRDHARYGPSSMERGINCPVHYFQSEKFDAPEPTHQASQGTVAHVAAAIGAKAKMSGANPNYKEADLQFDPEMIRNANAYADYIYDQVSRYLQFPHAYFIEEKFAFDLPRDGWGTADFVFLYKNTKFTTPTRHIHIVDYKYGRYYVDVENNWQLAAYAYAVLKTLSKKADFSDFHTVTTHIYQPRTKAVKDGNEEAGIWRRYTINELKKKAFPAIDNVLNISEYWYKQGFISDEDTAFFQRAGDWCQFCKAKGDCASYNAKWGDSPIKLFKKSLAKFEDTNKMLEPKNITSSGTITPEEISFIALNRSTIKKYIDAVYDAARLYIQNGHEIPGLKLIETKPNRSWDKDVKFVEGELKRLGIKDPISWEPKLITLTEAEEQLGDRLPEELTPTSKDVAYKLVPETHKSPAVEFKDTNTSLFQKKAKEIKKSKKTASNFDLDIV